MGKKRKPDRAANARLEAEYRKRMKQQRLEKLRRDYPRPSPVEKWYVDPLNPNERSKTPYPPAGFE